MKHSRRTFIAAVGSAAVATSISTRLGPHAAQAESALESDPYPISFLDDSREFGRINAETLGAAINHRDSMPSNFEITKGARWEFAGPMGSVGPRGTFNTGDKGYSWTHDIDIAAEWPTTGRINAVAYDPTIRHSWYVGSGNGGLWKGSLTGPWQCLSETWPLLCVSSIAVDKTGHNIYVGTGDCPAQGNLAMGVMRSQNGGTNWSNVSDPGFQSSRISRLVINPDKQDWILAAEFEPGGGIWLSTDGGTHWDNKQSTKAQWLCIEFGLPSNGKPRYCWALDSGGAIWRSDDGGSNWASLETPIGPHSLNRPQIICSPITPGVLYLYSPADSKVWSHNNFGNGNAGTWTDITYNYRNVTKPGAQALWYNYCIACTSTAAGLDKPSDVLFVGALNLWAIVLGGPNSKAWKQTEGCSSNNGCTGHADMHALAVSPFDKGEILFGNDGGAYSGIFSPEGPSLLVLSLNTSDMNVQQVYGADFVQSENGVLIDAAMQDTGTAQSTSGNWRALLSGDGGSCAISNANTSVQFATSDFSYAGASNGVSYTKDNWKSATQIVGSSSLIRSDARTVPSPIALDPFTSDDLYVATSYLYKYTVSTAKWTNRLGNQLLAGGNSKDYITALAMARTNGNTSANLIYTVSNFGEVWMSTDGGASWVPITGDLPGASIYIKAIAINPKNSSDVLLAAFAGSQTNPSGQLWRCSNTSAKSPSWTDVSGTGPTALPSGFPLRAVVHDPYAPDHTWYVGGDLGVFCTTNKGQDWANVTQPLGLPNVRVRQLKVGPPAQTLYAITYGRGIYSIPLSSK
jgi:hypothetical protein